MNETALIATVSEEQKLSPTSESIIKSIETMTVLELSELVKALESRFGVSAAMTMAVPAAAGAAAGQAVAEEGPKEVTVTLVSVGDKKIQVLKAVREVTGLGLKEAKEIVDSVPKVLKASVTPEQASEIKVKVEEQGAKVEIK